MKSNSILVSISCITYNHGKFIKQCLDGILNQKVDFKYEILVNDDASSDGTQKILRSYEEKYPDIIKPIYQTVNQFQKGKRGFNETYNFPRAQGKYIAFCEGDDYWTDTLKLQKQVDFLENNDEYNLVTGNVTRYYQNTREYKYSKKIDEYSFTYKDMITRNHCTTCTTLVRNLFEGYKSFKGWGTDSQMWIRILGKKSKGFHMGEVLAIYRKHDGSLSASAHNPNKSFSQNKKYALRKIEKAKFWNAYFDRTANESVKKVKIKIYKYIASLAKRENKTRDLLLYSFRYFLLKLL
jgi:glycosyltransferase involved in cell wall biosynthesis